MVRCGSGKHCVMQLDPIPKGTEGNWKHRCPKCQQPMHCLCGKEMEKQPDCDCSLPVMCVPCQEKQELEDGAGDTPLSPSPEVPRADSASPKKIQQEEDQEQQQVQPSSPNTRAKERAAEKERQKKDASSKSPAQSTRSQSKSKSKPGPKPAPKDAPPRQRPQPPKKTLEADKRAAANRRQQQQQQQRASKGSKRGRRATRQTTVDSQAQAGTSSQADTSTQVLQNTDTHVVDEEGRLVNFRQAHPTIIGIHPFPKKGRSPFYDAFHASPTDVDMVWCNLCGAKLQCTTKMGTASVRSHLSHKHPNLFNHLKKPGQTEAKIFESAAGKRGRVEDPVLQFKDGSTAATSSSKRARGDSSRQQLNASLHSYNFETITPQDKDDAGEKALVTQTLYLVCNGRPFSDANNPEFREMLEAAYQAGVKKVPFYFSPTQVREKCQTLASAVREDLKASIRGKQVTATFDHWTSRAKDNYSCLTLHWIDNFELKYAVVAVYLYTGRTRAEDIIKDFKKKLAEYGVEDTCPFVVTDTEAKMNTVGELLEQEGFQHIYCTAHNLQLTAVLSFNAGIFPDDLEEAAPAAAAAAAAADPLLDLETSDEDNQKPSAVEPDFKPPEDDDLNVEAICAEDGKAKTVLYKARRIVAYFNKSTQALAALRKIYDRLWADSGGPPKGKLADGWILKQDVVTRWWSTYTMLERLLCHHVATAIGNYYNENGGFKNTRAKSKIDNLTLEDWEALRQLKELLLPFKISQKQLEGTKYVTASLTPLVMASLQENLKLSAAKPEDNSNKSVIECAKAMKEDYQKRLGDIYSRPFSPTVERGHKKRQIGVHPALLIAHALDPRFKSLSLWQDDSIKDAIWKHILDLMVDLKYKWEMAQIEKEKRREAERDARSQGTETRAQVPPEVLTVDDSSDDEENPGMALVMQNMKSSNAPPPQRKQSPTKTSIKVAMKMQLDDYRRQEGLLVAANKAHKKDPLEDWWKEYHIVYPEVWKLAERYLAISATSAPSERAFSSAGIVLSIRRCRLKPNLLDDSVLLRENRHIVKHHANINLFVDSEELEFAVVDDGSTLT